MRLFRPNVSRMLDKRDVPGLTKALRDGDWEVRMEAAEALGKIGDEGAVEELAVVLGRSQALARAVTARTQGDPPLATWAALKGEALFRASACKALGQIGATRAVDALQGALGDDVDYVRSAAAEALGGIGDARASGPLREALEDADEYVRKAAADALAKCSNPSDHP